VVQLNTSDNDVAVLLCTCGGELADCLDFPRLEQELGALPSVVSVTSCASLCEGDACATLVSEAVVGGARRLVIAGCARRGFDAPLGDLLADCKELNDGLWWFVNIREQCALAHPDRTAATDKAARRLTAAVARVRAARPVTGKQQTVRTDVAVIGGGVSGLQAAVALARLGHRVTLVHRGQTLGGAAAESPELYGYLDPAGNGGPGAVKELVAQLTDRVSAAKRIHVVSGAALTSVEGELGNFLLRVGANGQAQAVAAGALVLATGTGGRNPVEATGLSGSERVVGMRALGSMIRDGSVPARVALIMDLTAEQGRAVTAQVLSAATDMATHCGTEVTVFCHSVRVAAPGLEAAYRRARNAGVVVTKLDASPAFSDDGSTVSVSWDDAIAGVRIGQEFDLLAVADLQMTDPIAGRVPGLRTGPSGEAQFDGVWLLPGLTNRPGVYVVGGARGNSELREALMDGLAVAAEVHAALGGGRITVCDDAATVDPDACVACLTCLRICPHGAVAVDIAKGIAEISAVSCQRCGACVAECPAQAITLPRFTDAEVEADIGAPPRVTVFACENSAVPAADGAAGREYPATVELVRVPCAGQVDPRHVLSALEAGAERVLVLGCHPESCQYLTGSARAAERIRRIAELLNQAGYDGSRVQFGGIASIEPVAFIKYATANLGQVLAES